MPLNSLLTMLKWPPIKAHAPQKGWTGKFVREI